ncbi:MAG: hypothetical protein Q8P28_04655 [Deltaproteobacteria bacterium]|nr:hypothetical protein [Deltaproteobacteria bacterium]
MITGIIKSAEEITGQSGCEDFKSQWWSYCVAMNKIAGRRIVLTPHPSPGHFAPSNGAELTKNLYDYIGESFSWKKDWLKDIQEEKEPIDLSDMKVDTPLIVWGIRGIRHKRYLAYVKDGLIYCWPDGQTSWTNNPQPWDYGELAEQGKI